MIAVWQDSPIGSTKWNYKVLNYSRVYADGNQSESETRWVALHLVKLYIQFTNITTDSCHVRLCQYRVDHIQTHCLTVGIRSSKINLHVAVLYWRSDILCRLRFSSASTVFAICYVVPQCEVSYAAARIASLAPLPTYRPLQGWCTGCSCQADSCASWCCNGKIHLL